MAQLGPRRPLAPPGPPGTLPRPDSRAGTRGTRDRVDDLGTDVDSIARIVNSVFVWRVVRADERLKIFRCLTVLTEPLCQVALPNPDPGRALFCEIFLYLTRPKALRLPPNTFFALFFFNRERRYCAIVHLRSVTHPLTPLLCTLTFARIRAATPPEETPDPTTEQLAEEPVVGELDGAYLVPAKTPPEPGACCALGPGAWWHLPSGQIYCWVMDSDLGSLCPPGSRARHLGWLLARITNHPGGCESCAPPPHIDSANALWLSSVVTESCPCVAPCLWAKMAQCTLAVQGDASLCPLLFGHPVDTVTLLQAPRRPCITDRLQEVVGGRCGADNIPPTSAGWRLCVFSSYISRLFATSCPTVARAVARASSSDPE
nr:tegument protein UL16 [Human alphaherpesvirus 1]